MKQASRAPTSPRVSDSAFRARTRLKKTGGSLVMVVPAQARDLLQLAEGQEMLVTVEGAKVIAEPVVSPKDMPLRTRRPKYTLDELVAGMSPYAQLSDEERDWMEAPAAGRELW